MLGRILSYGGDCLSSDNKSTTEELFRSESAASPTASFPKVRAEVDVGRPAGQVSKNGFNSCSTSTGSQGQGSTQGSVTDPDLGKVIQSDNA